MYCEGLMLQVHVRLDHTPHTAAPSLCPVPVTCSHAIPSVWCASWKVQEMAQHSRGHLFLTLGTQRGEAAMPTCQTLKLNWARNTLQFLLLQDRAQLSPSICGTRKGRAEFCGLEARRTDVFPVPVMHTELFSFAWTLCVTIAFQGSPQLRLEASPNKASSPAQSPTFLCCHGEKHWSE